MNRFSLTLLVGILLILFGVSGASRLSERAIALGFDASVVSNVNAPDRLMLLGFIGSRLASELIRRGESTVMVDGEVPRFIDDKADDKADDRKSGDFIN